MRSLFFGVCSTASSLKAGSWILQACLRAPGTAGDARGLAVWMEGEVAALAAVGSGSGCGQCYACRWQSPVRGGSPRP